MDCLADLQRAGDDEGRRKRAINKSETWDLLNKNWKALAVLAAEKTAPKIANENEINNREKNVNRSHRNRIEEEEVERAEWGWKTICQHQNKLSIPITLQHSNYQF